MVGEVKMAGNDPITLENELLRVEIRFQDGNIRESYEVCDAGKFRRVAGNVAHGGLGATYLAAEPDSGDHTHVAADYNGLVKRMLRGEIGMGDLPPIPEPGPRARECAVPSSGEAILESHGTIQRVTISGATPDGLTVKRRLSLAPEGNCVRVEVELDTPDALSLEYFEDRYLFAAGAPDFTWLPLMKWEESYHCPDWGFKSPAAILQKGGAAVAIVPDLHDLRGGDTLDKTNVALDMNVKSHSSPYLSYGVVPSVHGYHSMFQHVPGQRAIIPPGKLRYTYHLFLLTDVPDGQAYRPVSEFLWREYGSPNLLDGHAAQRALFSFWEQDTWHDYADRVWEEFDRDGASCGTLRCDCAVMQLEHEGWFCAWWNNMRTAYGLALYAKRANDAIAKERSQKILNLALDAPRKEGAFPVLFHKTGGTARWDRDHALGGYVECYHHMDMAWTSYWLLQWHKEIDAADPRILPVCRAYGDFALNCQRDDGFIPSYYKADMTPRHGTRLNEEGAEPAACALFLAELYAVTGDKKYLEGARNALGYLEKEIIPARKWFDYETFLSCSPKPYDFYDAWSGQPPQNNLAMIMAAKAFLAMYSITEEKHFLESGTGVLDYLSLTQSVWSHPIMTPNLVGGFTTQNSDAEWNDARQCYCAVLYFDYFEATGNREYLERGIAALRASFASAPYENWSHTGFYDGPGVQSGIHWGQGSGMVSVEMLWPRYGDIFVDASGPWAYGINGCTVRKCETRGARIALDVETDFKWKAPPRVVVRNARQNYEVSVNWTPQAEATTE